MSKRRKRLTWGDIFYRCLAKGWDHGYAAYAADKWETNADNQTTKEPCPHCRNGWFQGTEVECVNGVLIDIDEAHEGWQRDVDYPAAPCISKSGKWPKRDRGCQARLEEWADRGSDAPDAQVEAPQNV